MILRCLLSVFVLLSSMLRAQYAIPDPELVLELQGVVPEAMSGNILDTTHTSMLNLNYLDLGSSDVTDLDGLRYFTGMDSLDISFTPLNTLTELPGGLKWLDCTGADLFALPNDLPDGLEYLDCTLTGLYSLPTSWPSALLHLDASSNELTTLSSLPASLQYLDVNFNELYSIQALPASLIELDCQTNNLSSLPALPSGLITLHAVDNILTSLPTLPPALQYLVLSYNELDYLPALPASLIELYVPVNQLTSLPDLPVGLRKLSAGSNLFTALPELPDSMYYLYVAWNQIDSLPTLPDSLIMLGCSGNLLSELPLLPDGLEELYCNDNPITCLPALPPSLLELVTYGTGIICLPNIPPDLITDAGDLGFAPVVCGPADDCFLEQTITGVLFFDVDGDGIKTTTEQVLPHGSVEAQPGPYLGGADGNGRFSIPVDPGTYQVQGRPVLYHAITTAPYEVSIAVGSSDTATYIGYQPIPGIHDLVADIQAGAARPGFENLAYLVVTNHGTESSDATITLELGAVQSFVVSTIEPTVQSAIFAAWNASLAPGDTWSCIVTLYTDASVALGTGLMHQLSANSNETDTVPEDNWAKWEDEVVGSYDPNDKRPSARTLSPEQVQGGEWLGYTIRFQNTGNFVAENVVITDTLSSLLQWSTIQYVSASHDGHWVLDNGALTFSFNGIQLPDSASDAVGSQGYAHFRIKVDQGLAIGDSIVNSANIFFDFNEPVITGPAITRIEEITGINAIDPAEGARLRMVPNPANDHATLWHDIAYGGTGLLAIYDVTGTVLFTSNVAGGTKSFEFSTIGLDPGTYYFVLTVGAEKIGAGKLNVMR